MLLEKILPKLPDETRKGSGVADYVLSFLVIDTVFEKFGDGSNRAALVATIARQEQEAQVQGVSTIEWVRIIVDDLGIQLGSNMLKSRAAVLQALSDFVSAYDTLPEVQAYDEATPVPQVITKTTKRRKAEPQKEDEEAGSGIRIGNRKLTAIQTFLASGTTEVLQAIEMHLDEVFYKNSGLSDKMLQDKSLYPDRSGSAAKPIPMDVAGARAKGAPVGVKVYNMPHHDGMTDEQFEFLWLKLLGMHEFEAGTVSSEEAKAKCRVKDDEVETAKKVAKFWKPVGEAACKLDMSADEFQEFESTLKSSSMMDGEIGALMDRAPGFFYMEMLPSISASASIDDTKAMVEISAEAAAVLDAAKARLKLFLFAYKRDQMRINEHLTGIIGLRSLLQWKLLDHKRQQAQCGAELVTQYMKTQWVFEGTERIEQLSSNVATMVQDVKVTCKVTPRMLVLFDFNVPFTRDATRMVRVATQISAMLKQVPHAAALISMPDFAKVRTSESLEEEVAKLLKTFRATGMEVSRVLTLNLKQPLGIENRSSEFPLWTQFRLVQLKSLESNVEWFASRTVRMWRWPEEALVPPSASLLDVDWLNASEALRVEHQQRDIWFRAAQKGPEFHEFLFAGLLDLPDAKANDATVVVDLSPHAGDKAIGYNAWHQSLGRGHNKGAFYYLALAYGGARSPGNMGLLFSARRVAKALAQDWVMNKLELKNLAGEVVQPQRTTPELTESELDQIPGATAAWRGVDNIPFEACEVSGSQIRVKTTWCTEFATAPHQVLQEFEETKTRHEQHWAELLSPFIRQLNTTDGDGAEEPEEPDIPEQEIVTLPEIDSLEALKATENIIQEFRSPDMGCTLLMDDKHSVYALDSAGDRTIPKYILAGGYGGGNLMPANTDISTAIPFTLPEGDKSIVQLAKVSADESGPKAITGTLFSVLRGLEGKGHHDIEITKYGKAVPETQNGQRCYTFPNAKTDESFDYVLSTTNGASVRIDNFFKAGARWP